MVIQWRIELLGGLRAVGDGRVLTRFRSQRIGLLLAYLAYHRDRPHRREALIELLWPECDPATGRLNLRVALSLLRRQLAQPEAPGAEAPDHGDAVLIVNRASVQLDPASATTDVAEFEAALRLAAQAKDGEERARCLDWAVGLYRGELLPGYYEEWVLQERQWLAERYFQALSELISHLERLGEREQAVEYARRGVQADPLREEAHRDLIRLLAAAGQRETALRQYEELERRLAQELGDQPSAEVHTLAATLRKQVAVASAAAAAEPPPLPAPSASVGHLPLPLDRFFGRRSELVRLIALLRPLTAGAAADAERLEEDVPPRLITLTGPGGSGKTRLALEVARRLQPRSRAPIWFVPLQGLTPSTSPNSDGVPTRLPILEEVRDALHLPRTPGADPLEQLVATLREQPALVILDNFEHLVEGGAPLVHLLLQRIPTLTILVASRRRLNLPGEQELAVLPLPVPMVAVNADEGAATVLTTDHSPLTTVPSVQLFVDRAQTARAGFQLTPGNAPDVAQLCARLEGIPLAIELAAGRVGALTAAQILERLSDRFALLVSRGNGGEERHRSLRATLDWSYQLLSPALQQFFRRLSIFRGGWTLEAATEVCDAAEALDHLEQLRECSLIVVDDAEGQIRFRLLETLREFGEEQLTPAEQATLAERHAAFFKTLAERAEPRMHSPERYPCLARLGPELDNFRAALSWCLDTGVQGPPLERSTVGLELASALADFWKYSGHTGEGRDWLSRLLAAADGLGRTVLRAKAMESVARLVAAQYDDAITLEEESVALWREVGDRIGLARSLSALGLGKVYSGDLARARTLLEECLALLHESDDRWLLTTALDNRGRLEQFEGNLAQARTTLEEARSLNPGIGAEEILSSTLYRLGAVAEAEGRLDEARDLYERSMAVTSMLPATDHSCALRELGHVARLRGDYAEARVRLEECLALRQRLGHATDYLASAVCQLVEVMLIQGDHATATSLAEQWLARLDPAEHPYRTAQTLRLLARAAYETGELRPAWKLLEQAHSRLPAGGSFSLDLDYAELLAEMGERDQAQARFTEISTLLGSVKNHPGRSQLLLRQGRVELKEGEWQRAAASFREILTLLQERGIREGVPECFEGLAAAATAADVAETPHAGNSRARRAARLLGAAEALREAMGAPLAPIYRCDSDRTVACLRAALDEQAFAAEWAEGWATPLEQAVAEALADAGESPCWSLAARPSSTAAENQSYETPPRLVHQETVSGGGPRRADAVPP